MNAIMSCTVLRCIHENEFKSHALSSGTAGRPGWFAKISTATAVSLHAHPRYAHSFVLASALPTAAHSHPALVAGNINNTSATDGRCPIDRPDLPEAPPRY